MTNPVLLSVVLMLVLSLCRINVVLALTISAICGGLLSGMGIEQTIQSFEQGLGGGAQLALSYALLGAFAVAISKSGLTDYLSDFIVGKVNAKHKENGNSKALTSMLLVTIIGMAVASQNIVPVHIAFIFILIPPLLGVFSKLNLDRRLVACCLTFGLVTTYMWLPVGFGGIFLNQLLLSNLNENGLNIAQGDLPSAMTIPALGMILGLALAAFAFRKPRVYKTSPPLATDSQNDTLATTTLSPIKIVLNLVAISSALAVQLYTNSIIAGALIGFLLLTGSLRVKPEQSQDWFIEGVKMMSMIGFIMIAAKGFASVMVSSGGVPELVEQASGMLAGNQAIAAAIMLVIGLLITLGIGSSFSTIPIIAAIYVPLCISLGFSPLATAALIGTAAALGDAGSPASDSTLGPTAGLNADGQHDHIRDTVIPTFVFLNIPLMVFGWIAAMVL